MRKYCIGITMIMISITTQGWGSEINRVSREMTREAETLVPEFEYSDKAQKEVGTMKDLVFLTVSRKGAINVSGLGEGWWDLYLIAPSGEVLVRKKVRSNIGVLLSEYDVPTGAYLMELSQGEEKRKMKVVVQK